MVYLGRYEEELLQGKQGQAAQFAMEILLRLAESFGSEEFVTISSVQGAAHYGSLHDAGLEWLEKLAGLGGTCCVPTTVDPASISFEHWKMMGIDEAYAAKQQRLGQAIKQLGEILTWSCTPYYLGNVPRFGQNVAWAESSAVSFANSVLGARTNRTPSGLAVCAAITGRMPKDGLYINENREASIKVTIDAGELSDLDYNTLGIIIGKWAGTKIPAIYGVPKSVTNDNLKCLGASAATSGSVALYHIPGITPEVYDRDPFQNKLPADELYITRESLVETEAGLTTKHPGGVDLVVVGCPHYSISEIAKLARLMGGKKVKKGKEFWLYTALEIESLAKRMGLVNVLEEAGVRILASTCLVFSPLIGNYKTLMTDSGKFAGYLPSEHPIELIYASIEECVKAVSQ